MSDDQILHIDLFGGFRLTYEDGPVSAVNTPRLKELLAWLILHRESPQDREYLSFLLWPDCTERQAKANLRALLYRLRKALPEADRFLKIDYKSLQWNTEMPFILDMAEFESAMDEAEQASQQGDVSGKKQALILASDLYTGPLLPACYAEWIERPREMWRQKYNEVLRMLIELLEHQREYELAIRYGREWVKNEPYNEPGWCRLIELYARNNDRADALNAYKECVEILQQDLDIDPSPETRKLYERLKESYRLTNEIEPVSGITKGDQEWLLVGREQEWKQLLQSWKQILSGSVQCVLIGGEPGIGKSRLGLEFIKIIQRQGYAVAYSRSYEAAGTLSYSPVIDWLRSKSIRPQWDELEPVWLTELVRLIPELLTEHSELSEPGSLKEPWQRTQFFEAITRAILSGHKPRLLVIDDLQWCDRETLAWMEYLLHYESEIGLLMMGMLRPVEAASNEALQQLIADLRHESLLQEIQLKPLNESDTLKLAGKVGGRRLNTDLETQLYTETEGNPLFVVESVREGLYQERIGKNDSANNDSIKQHNRLPKKVTEVIASRFDHLSKSTRELMGLAAATGKEFTFSILVRASGKDEPELIDGLDELLHHFIIREKQDGTFDFTHDKLREVAYKKMSRARRRWLHRRIAEALEEEHKDRIEGSSSRIAFHFDRAEITDKAIYYYDIAAQNACNMYANRDALNFLNRAIELMKRIPDTEDKGRLQQSVYTNLAITVMQLKGTAYPQLFEACERAYLACTRLGEPIPAPIQRLQAIGKLVTGDLVTSLSIGEQLYSRAKKEYNQVLLTEAYYVLGATHFWYGHFSESKKYFEESLDSYKPLNEQYHIHHFGQNPFLVCKIRLSLLYWILGAVNKSENFRKEALNHAEEMDHPYSLDYVRYTTALLYSLQDNNQKTKDIAKLIISSSSEFEFPYWHSFAEILYGWTLTEDGFLDEGIDLMHKGLKDLDATGTILQKPHFYSLLCKALAEKGKFEEAIRLIDEALEQIDFTGERWIKSEIYRKKGMIVLKQNEALVEDARYYFQKAINIAREQGAVTFQKRAEESQYKLKILSGKQQ